MTLHRCLASALGLLALFSIPETAAAKRSIAVMAFRGDGQAARSAIVRRLRKNFQVVHGDEIRAACDALGISMTRGRNMARAAKHVGVVAVILGGVNNGLLSLAVLSGGSGQPLSSGGVACRRRLTKKNLRKALVIIGKGIRKAPRSVGRRKPKPPKPKPDENDGGSLTFEPDPVDPSGKAGRTGKTGRTGRTGSSSAGSSNSGTKSGEVDYSGDFDGSAENPLANTAKPGTPSKPTAGKAVKKATLPDSHGSPKVVATIGLGTWMRKLEINQPEKSHPAPKYDSGAAFALTLGFKVRPVAFFSDGIPSWFYSRLYYTAMLGLESKNKVKTSTGAEEIKTYSTSLGELRWEIVGIDWNALGKPLLSPHLEVGIGFGLTDFSIDWADNQSQSLPNASYKYFLASLGGWIMFLDFLGAHLRFDYRAVSGAGDIERDDWYGPASTGGINLTLGLDARYKGFVASFEYGYTRYFYSFKEANSRLQDCLGGTATCKKAAGGALDWYHAILFHVGYSL